MSRANQNQIKRTNSTPADFSLALKACMKNKFSKYERNFFLLNQETNFAPLIFQEYDYF